MAEVLKLNNVHSRVNNIDKSHEGCLEPYI